MNHPGDKLAAYVDGELGHDAREKVLAHLTQCAECRAEAEAQRRVKALLSGVDMPDTVSEPDPPAPLLAKLMAIGLPPDGPSNPSGGGAWALPPLRSTTVAFSPPTHLGRGARGQGTHPRRRNPRTAPQVTRRRLTFAAAGAFSMMAVALSSAFVSGTSSAGPGRPAGPVVERNLVERAATTGVAPVRLEPPTPAPLLAAAGRPLLARR